MARVTGVSVNMLLKRGQQIKVLSQLYRNSKRFDMVIPVMKSFSKKPGEVGYQGAYVLDPKCGFYQNPVATLDFASLYPSIMIAHNLCYSSLIDISCIRKFNLVEGQDYLKTPTDEPYYFINSNKRKGLLPIILEDILAARKKAKVDLKQAEKNAEDPALTEAERKEWSELIGVFDGRQLALKVSANSVYGFTGAAVGALPCMQIAGSVTAIGRKMIDFTRNLVQEHFTKKNGYEADADVIYGDTDSVMINFGVTDLARSMELGKIGAAMISEKFQKPIKLEFEKVYWPYLLLNRKRYAGLYWTNTEKWDKRDTKGMESVRRDNCLLVRNLMEKILDIILIERSPEKSIEYTKNTIHDLLNNRIDISWLVITKSLSKNINEEDTEGVGVDGKTKGYKVRMAHTELAQRIKKRDPANAPNIGDRIPYVITKGAKGARAYEKAEDPVFAMENDLP